MLATNFITFLLLNFNLRKDSSKYRSDLRPSSEMQNEGIDKAKNRFRKSGFSRLGNGFRRQGGSNGDCFSGQGDQTSK